MQLLIISFLFCIFRSANPQVTIGVTDIGLTDIPYQKQWTTLEKKILTTYVRTNRPVKNDSTRTVVRVMPFVNHISEVNEEEQTINVHGFLYMEWQDEYLTWDVSDFSGLDKITMNAAYIWKPDLMLYNSATGTNMGKAVGSSSSEHVYIYNDGRVNYLPPFSLEATCLFDYSDYPYDVQECPLILGSWSYTMRDMEIVPLLMDFAVMNLAFNDTKTVVSNWEVTKLWTDINYWNAYNRQRADQRPPESQYAVSFPELYVWLRFTRWAQYFGAVVLLPAVMTSIFTLAAFWTRSATTGIVLLMVNTMVQAIFTDDLIRKLPPSDGSLPKIVWYFSLNLTITVASTIILAIIHSIGGLKIDRRVPPVLRHIVYGRRFVTEKINRRFNFVRQVDEEDEEDEQQSENLENQQTTAANETSVVNWQEAANNLKLLIFLIIFAFYFVSMFALLLV